MLHDRRVEAPYRIEPTRLESFSEALANTVAEVMRIAGLRDRAERDVLKQLTDVGLLVSATPKGPVSLRISAEAAETLFPRLF